MPVDSGGDVADGVERRLDPRYISHQQRVGWIVAAFVTGTANYGWMLRDDAENSGTTRTITFSTKELATLAQAPQLVVTYVNVP